MSRPLGGFETALTLSNRHAPFVVVAVVRLGRGPDPERLRRALVALQRHHPLLAVRILERGGRFAFTSEATPPLPLQVLPRRGEDGWRRVVDAELNRRIDETAGPLARCLYLLPQDGGCPAEIVLTFHHAAMDGASATGLVGQLLRLCDPAGGEAPPARDDLPPPMESAFPAPFTGLRGAARRAAFLARQAADEAGFAWSARGGRRPAVHPAARCRALPASLDPEETRALVRAARRRRVPLHAALHAALLRAVHRRLYDGVPRRLRYVAFADLRPHLRPPPPADRLGSHLSMLRFTRRLGPPDGEGFWALAAGIAAQIDRALRRGDRFVAAQLTAPMMRLLLARGSRRMAATALSYPGPVALAGTPDALPVRDLRCFVSNLPIGPELTAQARLWGGALLLDFVVLDGDLDAPHAAALTGEVLATLRAASGGAGAVAA